ncbi:RDD family protein [Stenotrophomonas sp. C3(2023)]|uniref:RDD family protein n=1 Tax=Stenotrophomonas sp. C3(2023) TaxID=3080277 RepID=UPI00293CE572|nr:RDD family protein [Stenotrophomonas sp. C3(2023)]MDV3469649.1 RDD family protein [Stenotrophomonas sp. C3(2023)]
MTSTPPAAAPRPSALLGWRLLALFYDLLPVLALWMLASSLFVAAYLLAGHAARENIAPFSTWQWLLWACCWGLTGVYATVSWRRGGQTLGMRPWRLYVVTADGAVPGWRALWLRFAVATVSLLTFGLGFWWAWLDPARRTWHDRASGTRVYRGRPGSRAR